MNNLEQQARNYLIRRDGRFERDTYMPECFTELVALLDAVAKAATHDLLVAGEALKEAGGDLRFSEYGTTKFPENHVAGAWDAYEEAWDEAVAGMKGNPDGTRS